MIYKPLLPLLGAASLLTNAQHVDLSIPQTERYVSSMLSRFSSYTEYVAPPSAPTAIPKSQVTTHANVQAASCAFWMESIAHQGKAAFNNNSTYAVFRNVKDFGAKGTGYHTLHIKLPGAHN